MSTQAHTPGPWRLRMHPADPLMERPEYPDAVVDANGRNVVFCCVTMTTAREGEWLANARLIAAAPDMLAALDDVIELLGATFGEHFNPEDGQCAELCPASDCQQFGCVTGKLARVLAAHAKAEGRS